MSVAESWDVIHTWVRQRYPSMLRLLNAPADPGLFVQLEQQIGHRLPDDFKASYMIHDGSDPVSGILIGIPLMPLAEVGRAWKLWSEIADDMGTDEELSDECRSHPPGAVKLVYASRGWVPFAGDSQNYVGIDFDPAPAGTPGQIINSGRDDMIRHVIAGTFAGFLEFVAGEFLAGQVELGSRETETDPRWLKIAGKEGDLLTGIRDLLGLPPGTTLYE